MSTRERDRHDRETPPAAAPPTPDAEIRRTAERLFDEAEHAIARALSGDSAAFLMASRQASAE
ncbi:MAG: hypothetical protein IT293_13095 [Deltaproteobacteria bacterium]|nr:hypothetical protein [Deltaproteobacteria bacterium]